MEAAETQLRVLHKKLCILHFDGWDCVTREEVYNGSSRVYALFLRHILTSFPDPVASFIRKHAWFCIERDDATLFRSVLRLMREEFNYDAPLNATQVARSFYATSKMKICVDLIDELRSAARHLAYQRQSSTGSARVKRLTALAQPKHNELNCESGSLLLVSQNQKQKAVHSLSYERAAPRTPLSGYLDANGMLLLLRNPSERAHYAHHDPRSTVNRSNNAETSIESTHSSNGVQPVEFQSEVAKGSNETYPLQTSKLTLDADSTSSISSSSFIAPTTSAAVSLSSLGVLAQPSDSSRGMLGIKQGRDGEIWTDARQTSASHDSFKPTQYATDRKGGRTEAEQEELSIVQRIEQLRNRRATLQRLQRA